MLIIVGMISAVAGSSVPSILHEGKDMLFIYLTLGTIVICTLLVLWMEE